MPSRAPAGEESAGPGHAITPPADGEETAAAELVGVSNAAQPDEVPVATAAPPKVKLKRLTFSLFSKCVAKVTLHPPVC